MLTQTITPTMLRSASPARLVELDAAFRRGVPLVATIAEALELYRHVTGIDLSNGLKADLEKLAHAIFVEGKAVKLSRPPQVVLEFDAPETAALAAPAAAAGLSVGAATAIIIGSVALGAIAGYLHGRYNSGSTVTVEEDGNGDVTVNANENR